MQAIIYSNSFLEFLENSTNKVANVLYRLHNKRYISGLITDNEINYITWRKSGLISYLPAGKEHKLTDCGEWARDGRQEGKPAKVIRKLFTERGLKLFKDIDFENFSNEYKAKYLSDNYKIELLSNKYIKDTYDMERKEGGSLADSCMNDDSDYMDIYENCSSLEILRLTDTAGKLCGRSLVWNLGEFKLMDRIYTSDDHLYNTFLDYAKENGLWRKQDYKSYSNKRTFITPEGEEVTRNLTIKTNTDFNKYPYIDTFTYGEDGELNNYGGTYTYADTNGEREGEDDEDLVYCEITHDYIHIDAASYIEAGRYRGSYIHEDYAVCVGNAIYWNEDDQIINIDGQYYHIDDCAYSEYEGEFYHLDDVTYIDSMNDYLPTCDCYEVNGQYFHESQVNKL